jgi:hypothetical protein
MALMLETGNEIETESRCASSKKREVLLGSPMTTELWLLAASIGLGLLHLIAASHLISGSAGIGGRLVAVKMKSRLCAG